MYNGNDNGNSFIIINNKKSWWCMFIFIIYNWAYTYIIIIAIIMVIIVIITISIHRCFLFSLQRFVIRVAYPWHSGCLYRPAILAQCLAEWQKTKQARKQLPMFAANRFGAIFHRLRKHSDSLSLSHEQWLTFVGPAIECTLQVDCKFSDGLFY